jgi:hypothetical protein
MSAGGIFLWLGGRAKAVVRCQMLVARGEKMKVGVGTFSLVTLTAAFFFAAAPMAFAQSTTGASAGTGAGTGASGGTVVGGGANSANSSAQGTAVSLAGSSAQNTNSLGSAANGGTINQFSSSTTDLGRAVPNVYSPALAAAGYEVCLGSMSAGGSASGFGVAFGGTYEDKGCQARLNAKTLATLGYSAAAREIMCQNPMIRSAMRHAGTPCAGDINTAAAQQSCRQEYSVFTGWEEVCGP